MHPLCPEPLVLTWTKAVVSRQLRSQNHAQVLELQKLSGPNRVITCSSSSIDRHTYALTERLNKRSLPLKRIFTRQATSLTFLQR